MTARCDQPPNRTFFPSGSTEGGRGLWSGTWRIDDNRALGTRKEDLTRHIKCDVEIDVSGPTDKTVLRWTADTPRRIADRLERDEFEDGHHEVTNSSGRPVGTVYFDFYAEG